ncbi:hypothetical protein NQ317_011764 [Molorchus minor]|uniref:Uncharacterized protein n=1 Tax=Molorchus minor TaxID=1323400 RepID=A0ABQ9IVS1_9CUCU|nr:hypothetical protein NQ317_011764 [Molorchus minor]
MTQILTIQIKSKLPFDTFLSLTNKIKYVVRRVESYASWDRNPMPAVRSVCGLVNSYQPYPGGQGFPQVQGYYPQYPTFYPQYNPNYGAALPRIPPSNDGSPRVDTSEQDDLNGVDTAEVVRNERNIPEIQDVLKNFNKLPEFHGTYNNFSGSIRHHNMKIKTIIYSVIFYVLANFLLYSVESRAIQKDYKNFHSDSIVTYWPTTPASTEDNGENKPGWMRRQLIKFGQMASNVGNTMGTHATKITSAIDKICEVVKTVIPLLAAVCHVGQFRFCSAATEAPGQLSEAMSPSNMDLNIPD